ncbi:hypothetical protein [Cysteiniphilum sp. JM-1]|nr:hypothetical protein [Cysteiniphilum sp. JM-1]
MKNMKKTKNESIKESAKNKRTAENKVAISYSDEPMEFMLIDDFLPTPKQLMAANELERVSLNISKESKEFFIKLAKAIHGDRERAGYQKLMRDVLDAYAKAHTKDLKQLRH